MADLKTIFHIVQEMGEYEISWNFQGFGRSGNPNGTDYVFTSHARPEGISGKHIHIRHGHGVFPWIPAGFNRKKFQDDYKKFDALRVFGEMDKNAYVKYGYPEGRLMMLGMPYSIDFLAGITPKQRVDYLLSKRLNPIKKTVMYAPTWGHGRTRGIGYWASHHLLLISFKKIVIQFCGYSLE